MQKVSTLIIPAAGIGSRLQPLTFITTKELVRLVDRPIFYYLIKEAYIADIRKIIFIIHEDNTGLKRFIKSKNFSAIGDEFPGLKFLFVETNKRLGDGQAIFQAKKYIRDGEFFAVTMGDLLASPGTSIIKELIDVHIKENSPVISVQNVPRSQTFQYGVISPKSKKGRLIRIETLVEKPEPKNAPSTLIMTGKYVLPFEIFNHIEQVIKKRITGEARLVDALKIYAGQKPLYAFEAVNKVYDTGTKPDLLMTEIHFTLANPDYSSVIRRKLKI